MKRGIIRYILSYEKAECSHIIMQDIIHYQYGITVENLVLEILIEKSLMPPKTPMANIANHTHPYSEIFVCQKDSLALNTPEGIMYLYAGEVAIVPPLIPHHCLIEHDKAVWSAMSFSLRKQPVKECQDIYGLVEPYITSSRIIRFRNAPEMIAAVQEINDTYTSNVRFIASLHLLHLLCKMSEKYCLVEKTEQIESTVTDSNLVRLNRLDRIINTEFMQNLTADDIAKKLNISSRQLARIVGARYNKTLHQVITERRITTAATMLKNTKISIEKIAGIVGYSSKVGFWRDFQKMYEMTPMEYRKNGDIRID